jgi:hypothetical protein
MNDSPGWVNVREDAYGHAIDQAGSLVHDPRCWVCANPEQRQAWMDHPAMTASTGGQHG